MLELKGITKQYKTGDTVVNALCGIDLKFRKNEFVSILGPSGCGKTTLLNIVGGLDQYTEGDLIINGKSTKDFKDRDWDAYRNHSIGFVFQSYNLIPHQTVLQNVEIALTLTGVSKTERRTRAKKALESVGLASQLKKRPSEMSGGQMQRVAIARALVNNPDIILADEPTGALDTTTSVQVIDILEEISKDKLIIMVTHNPDIAKKYSSRIIHILDGKITDDTKPLSEKEYQLEKLDDKNRETAHEKKKPSMSFFTSFGLSLKNLLTKKGRTILTSFAGSIGIIGIALILSLSTGFTRYINEIQESTLSTYPLSIESSVTDLSSLMNLVMDIHSDETGHELDAVYSNPIMYDLVNSMGNLETTENDLKSFKKFLEKERADAGSVTGLHDAVTGVQYSYGLDLLVYTKNIDGTILRSDPMLLLRELMSDSIGTDMTAIFEMEDEYMESPLMSSMMPANSALNMWQEILPGEDGKLYSSLLENQYDMVYGSWPNNYDEIVLVLNENHEIDDLTLYSLGLIEKESMEEIMKAAFSQTAVGDADIHKWSYQELCDLDFNVILNSSCYSYDEATGAYIDLRDTEAGMNYLYDNGVKLKISGIIRPNEDATATMLSGSIGYTSALTDYVIENSNSTDAVNAQLNDDKKDIFTGLLFKTSEDEPSPEEKAAAFSDYLTTLSEKEKADIYIEIMSIPSDEYVNTAIEQYMAGMTRVMMMQAMIEEYSSQAGMDSEAISEYIGDMDDETLFGYFTEAATVQIINQYAAGVKEQLSAMTEEQLADSLDLMEADFTGEEKAGYYDSFVPNQYSEATYEENIKKLGYVDVETPSRINIYASTFESKDIISEAITDYNESADELTKITYTDYIALMMSSMTTIINTITYVLVSFVAISLIVSSIMIGVITLISVQERTKEIGILRAIGASKRNVSGMFNAETIIVGFTSGLLGVVITVLLCIPINILIHHLTGIMSLNAFLPFEAGVILVLISVLLTLFSGIIPSRSAAKKDPVVALRTE